MNDFNETTQVQSEKELFVKMVVSNWELQNERVNKLLSRLSDEQLLAPVAPDRNRGIYLLGHLAAVSDGMLPLLGLGDRLRPELETIFLRSPDNPATEMPALDELKAYWNEINATLSRHFSQLQPEEWFAGHRTISEADFAREPHRNKLNILINRTIHQGYHLGQLVFLQSKA